MPETIEAIETQLRIRVLAAPEPWEAGLLPVTELPLPEVERRRVSAVVSRMCGAVGVAHHELLLQMEELHRDGGAELLSERAPQWTPRLGLAIRPDQEPPRDYQPSDFLKLKPNMKPPRLVSRFALLAVQGRELEQARETVFGRGAVVQIGTDEPLNKLGERCGARLARDVVERAYQGADFYRPLLGSKALESLSAEEIEACLGGARFYLRESVEDKGVLIVTKTPLRDLLEPLGGELRDRGRPVWRIPAPAAE